MQAVYCRAQDRIGQPQLQRAILGTINLFILITSFQLFVSLVRTPR